MFKKITTSFFSTCAFKLLVWHDDYAIAPATGFFFQHGGSTYLITNWHVLSGRSPYDGQLICRRGARPNRITAALPGKDFPAFYPEASLNLYSEDGAAIWLMHPEGQSFDVAAIRINGLPEHTLVHHANDHNNHELSVWVGQDVFIIGFPHGLQKQGALPIWKRGSIASEPDVDLDDGTPVFLVDAQSRPGMSGSPVFRCDFGTTIKADGSTSLIEGGPAIRFIGVYSGRFGASPQDAKLFHQVHLGRVWKNSALVEMLNAPVPGGYEIRKE